MLDLHRDIYKGLIEKVYNEDKELRKNPDLNSIQEKLNELYNRDLINRFASNGFVKIVKEPLLNGDEGFYIIKLFRDKKLIKELVEEIKNG